MQVTRYFGRITRRFCDNTTRLFIDTLSWLKQDPQKQVVPPTQATCSLNGNKGRETPLHFSYLKRRVLFGKNSLCERINTVYLG